MKKIAYIIIGLLVMNSMQAQDIKERILVQTDKAFYLAGEKMGLKLYGTDATGKALPFSRVAYVELLGDKDHAVRLKVEMNDATGEALMQLPYTLASGIYDLVAYTRWMRNEGEEVFSRQKIAIFNSLRYAQSQDHIDFVEGEAPATASLPASNGISVKADKAAYGNRETVTLTLEGMPKDARMSVSVVRQDISLGETASSPTASGSKGFFLPEVEGLIIESKPTGGGSQPILRPNLTIQGDDIQYYAGQQTAEGSVLFYTNTLKGVKEVVAGMQGEGHLELVSPFVATPQEQMQPIKLYRQNEEALTERSLAIQVNDLFYAEEAPQATATEKQFPNLKPKWVYDLDHYKRFASFEETFIEFMPCVSTIGNKGSRRIVAFDSDIYASGNGNTLVLLDGVAIMNHEHLLAYDPHLTKYVEVYVDDFVFGDQLYNGILSVKTPNRKLSGFTLPNYSVVSEFEGTQANTDYPMPSAQADTKAYMPDFRHTLYWNPNVTSHDTELECRTSDMCGTYIVKVEGRTPDGKAISGYTSFEVK